MNRLLASIWMLASSASLRMNVTSLVLDGNCSGALDSSTGMLTMSPAATLISRRPCSLRSGSVKHVGVVVLILVHDLQAVDVFDPPFGVFAVQHAVFADVETHQ